MYVSFAITRSKQSNFFPCGAFYLNGGRFFLDTVPYVIINVATLCDEDEGNNDDSKSNDSNDNNNNNTNNNGSYHDMVSTPLVVARVSYLYFS